MIYCFGVGKSFLGMFLKRDIRKHALAIAADTGLVAKACAV